MIQRTSRAIRFLRTTARNSPWLVIAVALHVALLTSLALVKLTGKPVSEHIGPMHVVVPKVPELPVVPPKEPEIPRYPFSDNKRVELVSTPIEYMPNIPIDENPDPHEEAGHADDSIAEYEPPGGSTTIGPALTGSIRRPPGSPNTGGGHNRGPGGRHSTGDGKRNPGPTIYTEDSVRAGLTWLVRHQQPNGSWSPVGMAALCTPGSPCIATDVSVSANYDEGLTGLALLTFLGCGFGYDSEAVITDTAMGKPHVLGDVVTGGLKWLVQRQHDDGSFSESGFLYNEALATMAVCEAYALKRNNYLKEPARKAVGFLLRAQRRNPQDGSPWGWRYASAERIDADHAAGKLDDEHFAHEISDADLSATCWAVMALKSAQMARIDVPEANLRGALAFAQSVATDDGLAGYLTREGAGQKVGGIGEQFAYHAGTMTALDMLSRTFVARDLADPFLELGAKQLAKDLPSVSKDKLSVDYYYWYYATLALNQYDGPDSPRKSGKYWTPWNEAMQGAVLALQDKSTERDLCSRGGWLVDDRWSYAGHAIYNTAINTLTLEVYYRYANAFGAKAVDKLDTRGTDSKFIASPAAALDK
jgi:hypothetical protein